MAKYKWRDGGPAKKVSAEVFGKIVEGIAGDAPLETVKAIAIVNAARPLSSPIHNAFPWDDRKAAELYRRTLARHYLGSLQIVRVAVREGPAASSRAYFAVSSRGGYVAHDRVLSDGDLKKEVIAGAKRELETFVCKYGAILALGNYIPRLQDILDSMRDEMDQLEVDATRRRPTPQPQPPDRPEMAPV